MTAGLLEIEGSVITHKTEKDKPSSHYHHSKSNHKLINSSSRNYLAEIKEDRRVNHRVLDKSRFSHDSNTKLVSKQAVTINK